jgi:hypothetical protein
MTPAKSKRIYLSTVTSSEGRRLDLHEGFAMRPHLSRVCVPDAGSALPYLSEKVVALLFLATLLPGQTVCNSSWDQSFANLGLSGFLNSSVIFDDGSGPALYICSVTGVAGISFNGSGVARYDGVTWSSAGTFHVPVFTNNRVVEFEVYDDGSGSSLYACGSFTSVDGQPINFIAKRTGTSWTQLGSGLRYIGPQDTGHVASMAVHDDGTGSKLYVVGDFFLPGSSVRSRVARWDGSNWANVGSGFTEPPKTSSQPTWARDPSCTFPASITWVQGPRWSIAGMDRTGQRWEISGHSLEAETSGQ